MIIHATGSNHRLPNLTSGEVSRLTYLVKNSNLTEVQIAARFGISVLLTRQIVAGHYRSRDQAQRDRRGF